MEEGPTPWCKFREKYDAALSRFE